MTTVVEAYQAPSTERSAGVWVTAWRRLKNDRVGMISLVIVAGILVLLWLLGWQPHDPHKELPVTAVAETSAHAAH